MPHVCTRRILIGDVDSAGIAFTGRIIPLALEAFEIGVHAAGMDFAAMIQENRILTPIVHLEADFARPMRHGDEIRADLTCERIGDSSFTMRVDLILTASENLASTVRIVSACIDAQSHATIAVPASIRAVLETLQ